MRTSSPPRVAAVDIGTNSVLLLVAEQRDGALAPILDTATITRLGQGVDATGELAPDATERTLACLERYGRMIADHGATRVGAVATSAMRDARGGEAFLDAAAHRLGARPEVISGQLEAELTFAGALTGLAVEGPVGVFDLGGGSTEIIVGEQRPAGARLERAVSLDIGAVRLKERHLPDDPPSHAQLDAVRAPIRDALAEAPPLRGRPLVGVAGTVTNLAAVVHGVAPYDGGRVHGCRMTAVQLRELSTRLASCTLEQRRALKGMEPARADVIVAGALIVEEICRLADAQELIVSDRGVRWGLAANLANREPS